jgi:hypothetical protein
MNTEKSIEDKIRDKKNEIKKANRELSRLQEEAKKGSEPLRVKVVNISMVPRETKIGSEEPYVLKIYIKSNKSIPTHKIREVLESIHDQSKGPPCYVDWDKVPPNANYVTIDPSGAILAWEGIPAIRDNEYGWTSRFNEENCHSIGRIGRTDSHYEVSYPAWQNSLIHRPGAK